MEHLECICWENLKDVMFAHAPFFCYTKNYVMLRMMQKESFCTVMSMCHPKKKGYIWTIVLSSRIIQYIFSIILYNQIMIRWYRQSIPSFWYKGKMMLYSLITSRPIFEVVADVKGIVNYYKVTANKQEKIIIIINLIIFFEIYENRLRG